MTNRYVWASKKTGISYSSLSNTENDFIQNVGGLVGKESLSPIQEVSIEEISVSAMSFDQRKSLNKGENLNQNKASYNKETDKNTFVKKSHSSPEEAA